MKSEDMRRLEKELQGDLIDAPEAVFNRVRDLVKEFLLEEASQIGGKRVRRERDVKDLIHMHANNALLRRVIESPHQFSAKDLRDLFNETRPDSDQEKGNTNILAFVQNEAQAKVIEQAAIEAAKTVLRKQLPRGQQG